MAKHSKRSYGREIDEEKDEEDVVAVKDEPSYNKSVVTKKLQSMINARIKLPGPVTGKAYVWQAAGMVVEVDTKDADGLLAKTLGEKGCCGGTPYKLFQLVE